MNEQRTAKKWGIIAYITISIFAFALLLILPASREVFSELSTDHPYLMGFLKFALLATAGELLAVRLASGTWKTPAYTMARFVIWGLIGIWITYMMKIFGAGVASLMTGGLLPNPKTKWLFRLLKAFFISATMNLTFGPTFMAVHKCSDTYLDLRRAGKPHGLLDVVRTVDWSRFVSFTLCKTVPIFWIPAHTVTFLLPEQYQVMMAASLSVALGIILNLKKKPAKAEEPTTEKE